jgi:hypothetical protein
LVAWAEKIAKFVPFPSQVAPRGWGRPSLIGGVRCPDMMIFVPYGAVVVQTRKSACALHGLALG